MAKEYSLKELKNEIRRMYPTIVYLSVYGYTDPSVGIFGVEVDSYNMKDSNGEWPKPATWFEDEISDEGDRDEYVVTSLFYNCPELLSQIEGSNIIIKWNRPKKSLKSIPNFNGYYDDPENLTQEALYDSTGLRDSIDTLWEQVIVGIVKIENAMRDDITWNNKTKPAYMEIVVELMVAKEIINEALKGLSKGWYAAQDYAIEKMREEN